MDLESLQELARYQRWADAEHWKVLHANPALLEDAEIKKRLNHMAGAYNMLTTLARGEVPDMTAMKERESVAEIESAMREAAERLDSTLASADLEKVIDLPRGPNGPFKAPAKVLLLQGLMHSQHHRGQNAATMRDAGLKPPMTDFIIWYAVGRP